MADDPRAENAKDENARQNAWMLIATFAIVCVVVIGAVWHISTRPPAETKADGSGKSSATTGSGGPVKTPGK
jgi:hypothetical protein